MYSIRHRTLNDHPDFFDDLFLWLDDSDKQSRGIGKFTISLPFPLQLIKIYRRPFPIESTDSNKMPYPFHLEPTAR